jgi:surfactin synthase thioesterase subunit
MPSKFAATISATFLPWGSRNSLTLYLPVFRADYEIIWKYDFGKLDLRTEIPAEIFYSEEDTPLAEMEKWRRYFTGECAFHRYEGNHFFILEHHREMAGVLRRRLL